MLCNTRENGYILTCNPVLNCLSLILECWNTESTMRGCLLIQLTNSALVSFPFYGQTDSQSDRQSDRQSVRKAGRRTVSQAVSNRLLKRYNSDECAFCSEHCSRHSKTAFNLNDAGTKRIEDEKKHNN